MDPTRSACDCVPRATGTERGRPQHSTRWATPRDAVAWSSRRRRHPPRYERRTGVGARASRLADGVGRASGKRASSCRRWSGGRFRQARKRTRFPNRAPMAQGRDPNGRAASMSAILAPAAYRASASCAAPVAALALRRWRHRGRPYGEPNLLYRRSALPTGVNRPACW
jgi:hypothetical protein